MNTRTESRRDQWDSLCFDWAKCRKCKIRNFVGKMVFGRGHIDPDIVFIGEAPGKLEDVEGKPFVGLAGKLLDSAIGMANIQERSYFILNMLACRPCDGIGLGNRTPTEEEVENCSGRLESAVALLRPDTVILLGKTAEYGVLKQYWSKAFRVFCLPHPAWILRHGGTKSPEFSVFVNKLREAMKRG
jgi:uracil-DNA glycosylase